ncbi:hypothetical protein ACQF36_35675 [Streptomyces sp. Marseille-Q5077]|uniref:hypothetical protein n=1 Tax=Streptomyces sp. Marseille-Q5077 TaxID=3418995 RepID=UPI003D094716
MSPVWRLACRYQDERGVLRGSAVFGRRAGERPHRGFTLGEKRFGGITAAAETPGKV